MYYSVQPGSGILQKNSKTRQPKSFGHILVQLLLWTKFGPFFCPPPELLLWTFQTRVAKQLTSPISHRRNTKLSYTNFASHLALHSARSARTPYITVHLGMHLVLHSVSSARTLSLGPALGPLRQHTRATPGPGPAPHTQPSPGSALGPLGPHSQPTPGPDDPLLKFSQQTPLSPGINQSV